MTDTLISLISIIIGIIGANLIGFIFKKYSFDLVGNTIAGVFGSILVIKSFGRFGFDPSSIMESGSTNWLLFFINIIASLCGGALSIILMKKLQSEMSSKKETNQSLIKLFKVISLLEGLSYILLLFVGVPLKYLAGNAFLVKSLGMPHGILFVAYVVIALFIRSRMKWDFKDTFVVLIASLLPFGTFHINRKYL
ncbi:MAG: integral membrane protein [Polaribacter sp.]|jgi:integral membrane protein